MKILKYEKKDASFTAWSSKYLDVAQSVIDFISLDNLEVIHIGSTSFKVGGKGLIDLSVLYKTNDFQMAVQHLAKLGFQDQISTTPFPEDRPRKDGAVMVNGKQYFLHVHVIAYGSDEHKKQLKYKDYMLNNLIARNEYEASKKEIILKGFTEQEAYGKQKSPFVKKLLNDIYGK